MRKILSMTLIGVCAWAFSCDNHVTDPPSWIFRHFAGEERMMKAGIYSLPDTVSQNDPLELEFIIYVGPDGCHHLEWLDIIEDRGPGVISFEVWGIVRVYGTFCTMALVCTGESYVVTDLEKGPLTIEVKQPNGPSFLYHTFVK
jgi:hypothetical protein